MGKKQGKGKGKGKSKSSQQTGGKKVLTPKFDGIPASWNEDMEKITTIDKIKKELEAKVGNLVSKKKYLADEVKRRNRDDDADDAEISSPMKRGRFDDFAVIASQTTKFQKLSPERQKELYNRALKNIKPNDDVDDTDITLLNMGSFEKLKGEDFNLMKLLPRISRTEDRISMAFEFIQQMKDETKDGMGFSTKAEKKEIEESAQQAYDDTIAKRKIRRKEEFDKHMVEAGKFYDESYAEQTEEANRRIASIINLKKQFVEKWKEYTQNFMAHISKQGGIAPHDLAVIEFMKKKDTSIPQFFKNKFLKKLPEAERIIAEKQAQEQALEVIPVEKAPASAEAPASADATEEAPEPPSANDEAREQKLDLLQSFTDRFSKQAETQSSLYFGPDQAQQQVPYDDDMSNFVEKMKGQIQNEIGKGNITEDDAYRLLANETSQMGFQGNPLHRALTDHFRSGFVERREEEGQQRSSGQTEALNKLIRQIEKKSGKVSDLGQKFQGEIDIERKKKEREEFMRTNITEHLRRLNGKANQEVNKADIRRVEKQSRRIETQKRTFTPQVSPYASTIDKRNALVRRRFAKRIEQRDAMLSKPLKEALPKGHDLRVSNREKRNSRIKKITDEIQAKRLKEDGSEDTGFNTGHKMKVLYGRLGQLIDEHPDKRDQKNLYINAITKLMDLPTREDLLYSGVDIQTIANSQIVKGRQAIAPTKGSDFQSSLSQVNQTNSFAPLNKLTGFFRGLMRGEDTDRDTLSGYGRVAGDFELIKTRDYTNKVFKDKKGRAKQTQEKYFFQRRSDGKIIDNDELARRIHNAYEGNFSGEERGLFSSKKAQGFQGATRKEQIARRIFKETGFNLGRNTTFQSAQRGSEGTPFTRATRGQPAQPDTEKFFQEEMNSATYSNRVENFILSNAKRTYEARKPLMEMAQTTAQRFRDKQEADPTPFKNTSPSFNDLAQQTQDLKGYSAVIAGTKNIETGLPKDLDVKNFPNSAIANPAEYSATQRAKREMEQVEPAFKQVMGDLSTSIALKSKKAVKPADGTTVRAQNLKRMFMEKKDKYLQDWADPSTTKLTSSLGFDTLPSQAPSVGVSNLSIEEQENIQLAQVMESLGEANEGTRGAPEQSVLDDIDEEREQTRFSEIDGALRDLTLEKVARNIVAVKKQFMASYQTMKNVQKTIEGLGDSQGNPVGTIGNAMMRGGRLQNDLINSGLMGNNLISASGGQLFAPSGQNGFGNSNMNKDWGRFGYYGVGSNKQLGWGTYYNDLATDYDNGKYPIQIITDSLTDRNYLAPTSGQFNVGGQSITNVIPVGGKRAHNGVGDIASVSKFFMGSTPVYWFHTRPNPATTNQPIRENGKLVGKIYSSGSFQHGQIRMNTLTNPLIDENPNTPLASESLSIGDTVDYFVNESGYSGSNTMYLGNQAVVDSAQQTRYGEPKYRTALDFEVSAGNILSVQEARKGTATTKLKTGEQIKSEARRRQRKALGFNFAGYTERTVQGIQ